MLNRAGNQNSYGHNVRIGNWSEDKMLDNLKMEEYLHKKERGQLLMHQVQSHLNQALQEVGLTFSRNGLLSIGDHIMLYSVKTEGVLSVDVSTDIISADRAYAVTTSTLTQAPVARNVFVIESYDPSVKVGDPLRLGKPFRLRTNPAMAEPLYLASQPKDLQSFSRVSRNQEVYVTPRANTFDTVWVVQYKDISKRFEMEGQQVPGNSEIVLQHAATKAALASDKLHQNNDFGKEYEVCAGSYISMNKKQGLYQEKQGLTTTDIPVRDERDYNFWAFLTASVPELDPRAQGQSQSQTPPASGGRGGGGGGGDLGATTDTVQM